MTHSIFLVLAFCGSFFGFAKAWFPSGSALPLEVAQNKNNLTLAPFPYGDPYKGCNSGELNMSVANVPGLYCAPKCSIIYPNDCNPSKAPGVSAMPECMIAVNGTTNNYCALICNTDAKNQCDVKGGAECHHVYGNQGVCTYTK